MALWSGGGAGGSLPVYKPPTTTVTPTIKTPSSTVNSYIAARQEYLRRMQAKAAAAQAAARAKAQAAARAKAQAAARAKPVPTQNWATSEAIRGAQLREKQAALTAQQEIPYLPLVLRGGLEGPLPPARPTIQGGPSTGGYTRSVADLPAYIMGLKIGGATIADWMREMRSQNMPRQYTGPEIPQGATVATKPQGGYSSGSRYSGYSGYGGYSSGYGGYSSGGGGGSGEEEDQRPPIYIPPRILWRL